MSLANLLLTGHCVFVPKRIVKILGLEETILLMYYASKHDQYKDEFCCENKEIEEETILNKSKQNRINNKFKSLGFISIEKKGSPKKSWYTFHEDILDEYLESKNNGEK